jgi:hypothetical protein
MLKKSQGFGVHMRDVKKYGVKRIVIIVLRQNPLRIGFVMFLAWGQLLHMIPYSSDQCRRHLEDLLFLFQGVEVGVVQEVFNARD